MSVYKGGSLIAGVPDVKQTLQNDVNPTSGAAVVAALGGRTSVGSLLDNVQNDIWIPKAGMGRNLLDNPYFIGGGTNGKFPINQRQGYVVPPGTQRYSDASLAPGTEAGTTDEYVKAIYVNSTYSIIYYYENAQYPCHTSDLIPGNAGGSYYGIDRWQGGIYEIENGSIKIVAPSNGWTTLNQFFTDLADGDYVLSVLDGDNGLSVRRFRVSGTTVTFLNGNVLSWGSVTLAYSSNRTAYYFQLYVNAGKTATVKAAKLELGSQQTLAHQENGVWVLNEIPDYGEELAKCQRYYQKVVVQNVIARAWSENNATMLISLPVTMARNPAATVDATGAIVKVPFDNTYITGFTFASTGRAYTNGVHIGVSKENAFLGGGIYMIYDCTCSFSVDI